MNKIDKMLLINLQFTKELYITIFTTITSFDLDSASQSQVHTAAKNYMANEIKKMITNHLRAQ